MYFCAVNILRVISLLFVVLFGLLESGAQNYRYKQVELPVDLHKGDTLPVVHMREVFIYQPPKFRSRRAERVYWRTVRDVKKTLPLAREIRGIIIETYEYLLTLPNEQERSQHIERVENGLMTQYTPVMRKLTFSQGKMLIKLIDRECDQTGYELIKTFMGGFKARFYQTFASLFGASLKKEYNPNLEDAEVEEVIFLIENGYL